MDLRFVGNLGQVVCAILLIILGMGVLVILYAGALGVWVGATLVNAGDRILCKLGRGTAAVLDWAFHIIEG